MNSLYIWWLSLLFIKVLDAKTNDALLRVAYWDVKPFIYKQNNKLKGLVPDIMEYSNLHCYSEQSKPFVEYYEVAKSYKDFQRIVFSNKSYFNDSKLTIWVPIISTITEEDRKNHALVSYYILISQKMVLIVQRYKITMTYKIMCAIENSSQILFLAIIFSLMFGVVIWAIDKNHNVTISHSYLKGPATGIWCSFVTLVGVGYGDVTPRSFLARLLTMIWIILGLTMAGTLTSTIFENVSNFSNIEIYGKKIAVLKGSFESKVAKDEYNADLYEQTSYINVFDAMRNGAADVALVNSDVAAAYQHIIRDDDNKVPLRMIKEIASEQIIQSLLPGSGKIDEETALVLTCIRIKKYPEIFDKAIYNNQKYCKIDKIHYYNTVEMFTQSLIIQVLFAVLAGLTIIGLLVELHYRIKLTKANKQTISETKNNQFLSKEFVCGELEMLKTDLHLNFKFGKTSITQC